MSRTVKKVMCKSCGYVFKKDFEGGKAGEMRKCICPKCRAVFDVETPHIKPPKERIPWKPSELAVIVPASSVVINLLLWLIPWVDYTPGVTGRGFPLVWYTKWAAVASAPVQINIANFFIDLLIIAVVVCLLIFETSVFKKIRFKRKKKKAGVLK